MTRCVGVPRVCSALELLMCYTVSQNKTPTGTQSFCDNFWQIWTDFNNPFTIASCRELRKKLLYNLPAHLKSVAALPCEIWMLNWTTVHYSHSIQKCAKSFIFSKYLQGCRDLDDMSMPIHLQCYSTCSKYPPLARRHALSRARHCQWMCQWYVVQCWVKCITVNRRCRNLLYWCDVKWVNGTHKRKLS